MKLLPNIVYFTQRNNAQFPMRSCFPTSLAMALRTNGFQFDKAAYKTPHELDDYIMYLANSSTGQTIASVLGIPKGTKFLNEWWSVMAKVSNHLGVKCVWKTFDAAGIRAQIDRGKMVVVGTKFTGSGHIVTVSGYQDNGNLIVCDPFGNPVTGYYSQDGKNVKLNERCMGLLTKNVLVFP
jgi:hypothetical protein